MKNPECASKQNEPAEFREMLQTVRRADLRIAIPDVEAFKEWYRANETRIRNKAFLNNPPEEPIITQCTKEYSEMTPTERQERYQQATQTRMKQTVAVLSSGGQSGFLTSVFSIHIGADRNETTDQRRHTRPDRPHPDPTIANDRRRKQPTRVPEDILGISKAALREFRWNDPEGYDRMTDALKTEMGPHYQRYEDEFLPKDLRAPGFSGDEAE